VIWVLLGLISICVGTFGTLIGAAGGFLLVPILLFLYPQETPATITSTTLTVAFFNALSGSIAYSLLKRIDYRSGLAFSAASVIGAVIGANVTALLSRGLFQYLFGATIILVAVYLFLRPYRRRIGIPGGLLRVSRSLIDTDGIGYSYSFSLLWGLSISFGVGFISSLLGIGGGIIHVPAMTQLLYFPVYVATATSQFVIAITTLAAVITHIATGTYTEDIWRVVVLSAGAIIGAQLGARLSRKVSGTWIIRLLAAGMILVGIRLLLAPL
jgi:uncharacterized membrane protein YfcA